MRELQTPRDGSVTEAKIVNGAVTARKLGPGAVSRRTIADRSIGAADIAVGAVTGAKIADGSLNARDLGPLLRALPARPADPGRGRHSAGRACRPTWPPSGRRCDISRDLVLVVPDSRWPQKKLTFNVKLEPPAPKPGRFTLSACNVTEHGEPAFTPSFRYVVIDLP